jgi:hypothetical protein
MKRCRWVEEGVAAGWCKTLLDEYDTVRGGVQGHNPDLPIIGLTNINRCPIAWEPQVLYFQRIGATDVTIPPKNASDKQGMPILL